MMNLNGMCNTTFNSVFTQTMQGWFESSRSAFMDFANRKQLVSQSRTLIQTSPLAAACIEAFVFGVVGSGLVLTPENKLWEGLGFTDHFDAMKTYDLYQMQQTIFRTFLSTGECFLIRDASNPLSSWSIVEPDHIFTPSFVTLKDGVPYYTKTHPILDGIEYDSDGKPYALHYCENPYISHEDKSNWRRIFYRTKEGIPNVLHIRNSPRPEYNRGIPILTPLISELYSLICLQEAQVQLGIIQSSQAFVIKTTTPNKSFDPTRGLTEADLKAPLIADRPASPSTQDKPKEFTVVPPNNRSTHGQISTANYISPGSSYHLGVDESIEHLKPEAPGSSLNEFYDLVVNQCCACLGIPKPILTGIFDNSFSSSKASIAQWNYKVACYRKQLVNNILKPMYEVFLKDVNNDPKLQEYHTPNPVLDSLESSWRSIDPPLHIDEVRTFNFYRDALRMGMITKDEASMQLFGHKADGESTDLNDVEYQLKQLECALKERELLQNKTGETL